MFQRLPSSTRSANVKIKRLRLRVVSEKSCKYTNMFFNLNFLSNMNWRPEIIKSVNWDIMKEMVFFWNFNSVFYLIASTKWDKEIFCPVGNTISWISFKGLKIGIIRMSWYNSFSFCFFTTFCVTRPSWIIGDHRVRVSIVRT